MTRRLIPVFALLLGGSPVSAQEVKPRAAFEVASVKPSDPAKQSQASRVRSDPGRINYEAITLKLLIVRAYDVLSYQLNAPSWLDAERFDVAAKIPEGASVDEVPAMLQNLLAERFGLKVHWDNHVEPGFALVTAKNGPRLKRSDESATPTVIGPYGTRVPGSMRLTTFGRLEFSRVTMTRFARALSVDLDRPVVDLTGLEGTFDISLDVDPASLPGISKLFQSQIENPGRPSISNAIQDLGLKLEPRKVPVAHLVIDHLEKSATEN